ncbi:hypothetical protein EBB79_01455 [Parasedimentitalea marina]|uniref:Uncharacterized protein n=1 Tax=Parasedimentitalea marina TaxID=2483033 RepID=A0A3T0MY47_9RHOB|nr:hypothetical protein [Parasedimentitalea marina]AZV76695.1 hypothetical protein EBB79_01455 [Parasedimentitalea marina]
MRGTLRKCKLSSRKKDDHSRRSSWTKANPPQGVVCKKKPEVEQIVDHASVHKYVHCMGYRLLDIQNGHFSLEFELEDRPCVASAIKERYGIPEETMHIMCTEYYFGGSQFVFQDEWDAPCLISTSHNGNQILKMLHVALTEQGEKTE